MKNYIQQGPYFVGFTKGYDHRENPKMRQYGQHGATLWIGCRGEAGAIEMEIYTGWLVKDRHNLSGYVVVRALAELTFENASEDSSYFTDSCGLLDGRACVCTYQNYSGYSIPDIASRDLEDLFELVKTLYEEHYNQPLERTSA